MSDVSEYTVHTVLNYLITEAVRRNKDYQFKLQIPYEVLSKFSNEKNDVPANTVLLVECTMRWSEKLDEEELSYG